MFSMQLHPGQWDSVKMVHAALAPSPHSAAEWTATVWEIWSVSMVINFPLGCCTLAHHIQKPSHAVSPLYSCFIRDYNDRAIPTGMLNIPPDLLEMKIQVCALCDCVSEGYITNCPFPWHGPRLPYQQIFLHSTFLWTEILLRLKRC